MASNHGYNEFNSEFLRTMFDQKKSEPKDAEFNHHIKEINESGNLGATGKFPLGKIDETDEGEIQFAVAKYDDRIIINFGKKPVQWIGLHQSQAIELAKILCKHAGIPMTIET